MYRITLNQLHKICIKNKYILLQDYDGFTFGVNCKVAIWSIKKYNYKLSEARTCFIGYKKCSFIEYIGHKIKYCFFKS